MKKIISLIASVAMLASMATSVFAAEIANNAPAVETTVTEISAEEYENDWVGEVLPAGEKAYLVEITADGLDLSSVRSGGTAVNKKKRDGVLLMYASYKMNFDNLENVTGVYSIEGFTANSSVEKTLNGMKNYDDVTLAYPVSSNDNDDVVTANSVAIHTYVVTTCGEVVGTPVAQFKISSFAKSSQTGTQDFTDALGNITYTVNGEAATTVTFGKEEVIDPPTTEVVLSDKIDLEAADGVKGAAWDVTIKNFDSAKAYMATFTNLDNGEVRRGYSDEIDVSKFAETTGDVSFAVIMKLLTVTNVGLDIAIQ